MLLQSSTAVAVLVSNFATKGTLSVAAGLAILLGADLGSAMVTQVLLVQQAWMIPLLLIVGTGLFLKGSQRKMRQVGRVLIGLALIFISLGMLRATSATITQSDGAVAILEFLQSDLSVAFVVAALFTWAIHSSVAAVLLFVTMAAQGALFPSAAIAMVLGANLGGAMIAFVLTLAAAPQARQIVIANLVLRGGGALLILAVLNVFEPSLDILGETAAARAINLHLAFNLGLCLLSLPLVGLIAKVGAYLASTSRTAQADDNVSALNHQALDSPPRALSCAARETLRMGERIESMLSQAIGLFARWDDGTAASIQAHEKSIRKIHFDLKLYIAELNRQTLDESAVKGAMDLSIQAANLEAAADVISRKMVDLAARLDRDGLSFSNAGEREINDFYDRVLANVQLAISVMMTHNPDDARQLVAEKDSIRSIEQKFQKNHLGRLRDGLQESIETSTVHQETLRALKQINASFAMAGYPILVDTGDLLSSRLSGHKNP